MVNVDAKVLKQLENLSCYRPLNWTSSPIVLTVKTFKKDEIVFAQDEQAEARLPAHLRSCQGLL